jgi:hypothetical protein
MRANFDQHRYASKSINPNSGAFNGWIVRRVRGLTTSRAYVLGDRTLTIRSRSVFTCDAR